MKGHLKQLIFFAILFFTIAIESTAATPSINIIKSLPTVEKVVIEKSKRKMYLLGNGVLVKEYPISLGGDPLGPKTKQGDSKTPEGIYTLDYVNYQSKFHLALHISYPNSIDRERAHALGVNPGGAIFIHGHPNSYSDAKKAKLNKVDWTDGCIGVTDTDIREIITLVPIGTTIKIVP